MQLNSPGKTRVERKPRRACKKAHFSAGLCAGLLLVTSMRLHGAEVCGLIASATWTVADSPVRVQCDLDIAELTIEAGVEVVLEGDYEIAVLGVIRVLGTREDQVVIKPADTNATGWQGFYFEDVPDGSEFRWARIEGAKDSALHLVRSTPSIDHVTFADNAGDFGGALRVDLTAANADLQIRHSLFERNVAAFAGGAIHLRGPTGADESALDVTDSVFVGNRAGSLSARHNTSGGAIHIEGSSRILRSAFIENEVQAFTIFAAGGRFTRGGALYHLGGRTEIEASTFLRNASRMSSHSQTPDASRGYGGALYHASGELMLTSSLIAQNELVGGRHPDKRGAGIYVQDGAATITNSTLASNSHEGLHHAGGSVDIVSSIVYFNGDGGPQLVGSPVVSYSNVQGAFPGTFNIDANPVFDARFAIIAPSPSIDAGHPDPQFNDLLPPGLGADTNDQGYTGGPAGLGAAATCYRDGDADGFGESETFAYMDSCAGDFISVAGDCNDADEAVFPGKGCFDPASGSGVCGLIEAATWTVADSPVRVQCDLDIADLTIEAGVEVILEDDYEIAVLGLIRVLGTREAPVVIKPAATNTVGWQGFYFEDVPAGSEFRWARIEGAHDSALHLVRSTPLIDHVTFADNAGDFGGALRVDLTAANADLQIRHSLFERNVAAFAGGAIHLQGPTGADDAALDVTDSVFVGNRAGSLSARHNTSGGAMRIEGSSRIVRSTFIENEVQAFTIFAAGGRFTQGGALYHLGGRTEIEASTFLRNASRMASHSQTPDASRGHGGALYQASGELTLTSSLIADNELVGGRNPDKRGAGIYVRDGVAAITNSTLASNSHEGLYHAGGSVDIVSSIVYFNGDGGPQLVGSPVVSYSNVQGAFPGTFNINANPVFDARFVIIPPSPSIDAGHPDPQFNDLMPPGLGADTNDQGYTGGPGALFPSIADAGDDQTVRDGSVVVLDGAASHDLDGTEFAFSWRQSSGPSVTLSDPNLARPTFVAPDVAEQTILVFQLVLDDGQVLSAPNSASVTVNHIDALDLDDNGQVGALTDGLLVMRYLFDFRRGDLTNGAVADDSGCQHEEVALVQDCIEANAERSLARLDVDGDGQVLALSDGLIILRLLFGFDGSSLTDDVVGTECVRCLPEELQSYVRSLMPEVP